MVIQRISKLSFQLPDSPSFVQAESFATLKKNCILIGKVEIRPKEYFDVLIKMYESLQEIFLF